MNCGEVLMKQPILTIVYVQFSSVTYIHTAVKIVSRALPGSPASPPQLPIFHSLFYQFRYSKEVHINRMTWFLSFCG